MEEYNPSKCISRRVILAGATALVGATFSTPSHASDLVVVVHPDNRDSPSRAQLAAIFTTRKQSWGNGDRIVPFNFPPKHQTRVVFDKNLLDMSPDEVARYWIDRRIRGGTPPPKSVNSPQMLVKLVSKLEGAVAYVPRELATGVRILTDV